MSRIYDEVFVTPGDRLIGFLIVMVVSSVFAFIPYMAWFGGLMLVHYCWWWWMVVESRKDDEEWRIGR